MSVEVWLAFVAASAILLIIPGPAILTVISYSVAHGRRANVPLVTAVALGDSTALVLSLLGLGALLATSAFWFTVIQWTGGLYLVYLGIKLLRAGISASKIATPTTMRPIVYSILACLALLAGCTAAPQRASMADLQKQVVAAERWFAKSLADRNHVAFMTFLSDEAIFFT